MEPLNRLATELIDEAIDFADELAIDVYALDGDAAVVDFGVDVPGATEAGLLLTEIQTAGLATVQTTVADAGGRPRTHVELSTDHPALALLCAAKGGWELSVGGFEGLGSGPARALVAEESVYEQTGYREVADFAVLAVETDRLPGEAVAAHVAERTGVAESSVFLPAFAAASLTGSVVAASRASELATMRLTELGYDPQNVLSVTGSAPVPPVAADEAVAMAWATDAVAYGGQVHLVLEEPPAAPAALASTAATEYGLPFVEIFESVDWAYAELDRALFAPAQVTVDVVGGDSYVAGEPDDTALAAAWH